MPLVKVGSAYPAKETNFLSLLQDSVLIAAHWATMRTKSSKSVKKQADRLAQHQVVPPKLVAHPVALVARTTLVK